MYYMREALRGVPSATMPRPGGLIDMRVNALTGTLAAPDDPDAVYETFMLEHQPRMSEAGDPGYAPANSDPNRPADKGSGEPIF
jgi:penicillin-binding protein 1A